MEKQRNIQKAGESDEERGIYSENRRICKEICGAYEIKVCSPIIAQAILESGWGESRLAKDYHNYFGLKCGTKWQGKSVNLATWEEYEAGTAMVISDYFRVFDNMEEGVKGYFELLQLPRYQNLKGITEPGRYLETIWADGYATSSVYVQKNYDPDVVQAEVNRQLSLF